MKLEFFSTDFLIIIKFHESSFNRSRVLSCGQMDGRRDGQTDGQTDMLFAILRKRLKMKIRAQVYLCEFNSFSF
jgi:hypothetical protein